MYTDRLSLYKPTSKQGVWETEASEMRERGGSSLCNLKSGLIQSGFVPLKCGFDILTMNIEVTWISSIFDEGYCMTRAMPTMDL